MALEGASFWIYAHVASVTVFLVKSEICGIRMSPAALSL
jgi:hypothetical protein